MKHVLIVDDNKSDRFLIGSFIQKQGHVVHDIADGVHVSDTLNKFRPDLVILDLYMPIKEGIETLAELQETAPEIPVIVMSCDGDIYRDQLLSLGARYCIQKPFEATEFNNIISEILK